MANVINDRVDILSTWGPQPHHTSSVKRAVENFRLENRVAVSKSHPLTRPELLPRMYKSVPPLRIVESLEQETLHGTAARHPMAT